MPTVAVAVQQLLDKVLAAKAKLSGCSAAPATPPASPASGAAAGAPAVPVATPATSVVAAAAAAAGAATGVPSVLTQEEAALLSMPGLLELLQQLVAEARQQGTKAAGKDSKKGRRRAR
jgi:hypothetical protein